MKMNKINVDEFFRRLNAALLGYEHCIIENLEIKTTLYNADICEAYITISDPPVMGLARQLYKIGISLNKLVTNA